MNFLNRAKSLKKNRKLAFEKHFLAMFELASKLGKASDDWNPDGQLFRNLLNETVAKGDASNPHDFTLYA